MSINLNGTTPAAPTGSRNVLWQQDSSGNTSAYLGLATIKTTIAPIAGVVTINAALGNSFLINVTAAVTSTVITNPTDGQEITLLWVQDGTGHAITLAGNMLGGTPPSATATKHSTQKYTYNAGDTNHYNLSSVAGI